MRRLLLPALAGVVAAAAGLALAQLVAALTRPESSPLVTIGGTIIDATPTPVKEYAVRTFGTYDKPLLFGGIMIGLTVVAALIGILAGRRLIPGLIAAGALGAVGVTAALSRPTARPVDALPALLAGAVAVIMLYVLIRRLPAPADGRAAPSRRGFLKLTGIVAGGIALAGAGSWLAQRVGAAGVTRSREAITLPVAAEPALAVPAGTPAGFYTRNADFYRVDTALTVPRIDVERWQLRIRGAVDRPLTLSFDDLLRRPLTERDATLNCVSNEVGGPYVGNARWIGVPVSTLLREAGVRSGADQIVARSSEGMTIGTPLATVLDGRDALLALGMNGEALPLDHGFPLRMITPGLYGYVGACKWIVDLEVTTFDAFDPYWVQRGWAAKAPVKTASRIDRPAAFARLRAGENAIAGVAWAQHRGIEAVEVQVDDGAWQRAVLAPVPSTDTWVQWSLPWRAAPGGHTLRVRAIDKTGDVQTEQRATPFPDGASGWHTIAVTAT